MSCDWSVTKCYRFRVVSSTFFVRDKYNKNNMFDCHHALYGEILFLQYAITTQGLYGIGTVRVEVRGNMQASERRYKQVSERLTVHVPTATTLSKVNKPKNTLFDLSLSSPPRKG